MPDGKYARARKEAPARAVDDHGGRMRMLAIRDESLARRR
jgi:hypothetical protein